MAAKRTSKKPVARTSPKASRSKPTRSVKGVARKAKASVKRGAAKLAAAAKKTAAPRRPAKAKAPARAPSRQASSPAKAAPAKAAPPAARNLPPVGAPAPDFQLPADDGKRHSLAEHRGQAVVLYFYPKDDTPGCTKEACDFRDNLARVQARGAVVYGISRDSLSSHERFRNKYQLNFPLLSDAELAAHRAYGAWGQKSLYGRTFEGTIRSTFLIDREGRLARAWPKVSVTGHVDEVLEAIAGLP